MVWLSIQFILFYQRLAPRKLRGACRFTPTCSEGWKMALNRLGRCKYPNNGEDLP